MTTPVEAKPSVQGLATWLRIEAESGGVTWEQIHQLRAWASAVESLEASRIAPEGQAQPVVTLIDCSMCRGTGRHGISGQHCHWCDGTGKLKRLAASPQAVPAQADMTPDLHAAIMNLPCNVPENRANSTAECYKRGHKDARHAAAELVSARKETP